MKEILDFLLENAPVPAQLEYLHEAFNATEECEFVKTEMARAYNPWHDAYLTMAHVYKIPLGSAQITDNILQLDLQRDQTGHAVDIAIEAAMKSIDPEMVAAAKALAQTKVSFPVDTRKGYLYQTAQLDLYVAVMLGEQLENTTKVGVLPLVQNLKVVNDQIHELISERGNERVEKGLEPTRPEARIAAINTWRTLVKFVNGYNLVILSGIAPNPELDFYIDTMNEKGKRFRSIYLSGSGNHQPGSSGNPEDGPDNPNSPSPTPPEGSPTPTLPGGEGSGEDTPSDGEQDSNPESPNPENPGNNENTEGGENNGSNNGENNGGNGENNTNTPDPDDPWYNPDDEPD